VRRISKVTNKDPRILVALGTGEDGEVPTVILGVTNATWDDLDDGKAQDIDLEKMGIPAKLLIMRGTDHEDIVRRLSAAVAELSMPDRLADLSIPKPKGR
jgi:hypothetical protein